jgi:hypothetical protein
VTDLPASPLGVNQQTYERLKTSLSLRLRRQIFIGVCDDLWLRDRLARQLEADLSAPVETAIEATARANDSPKLVTLDLDLQDPDPIALVNSWLSSAPQRRCRRPEIPAFQILGIERLTRQSAADQNLFLAYLQEIEPDLPLLESGLLLWMTQPWFRMLPEAAPEFWRCRTGIFEFAGDPTPLLTTSPERIRLDPVTPSRDRRPRVADAAPAVPTENPWLTLANDLADNLDLWYEPDRLDEPAEGKQAKLEALDPHSSDPLDRLAPPDWTAWISEFSDPSLGSLQTDWLQTEDAVELQANQLATLVQPMPLPDQALESSGLESSDLQQQIGSLQQQIALLQSGEESPVTLAIACRTLGNFYRDCIEQGDVTVENLARAIQAYEQSLPGLYRDQQAEVLNDLGNLYWNLAQVQAQDIATDALTDALTDAAADIAADAIACLQRALQLYQLALDCLEPQQLDTYAMLQNNLGGAYADLARYQNPQVNLEQSVQAYQQALQSRTAEDDPIRYASTQNNLGTTYWNLAQQQQPTFNLKQAIVAYAEALNHYSAADDPLHYAMIQNNLGTAYWNLAQYEPSEAKGYLMLASLAYQAALQYRRLETHPAGFAATQNNLGTAQWHLANQTQDVERQTYLVQAIAAYEAALAAADSLRLDQPAAQLSFDLSSTQNNLGLAHYHLALESKSDVQPGGQQAGQIKSISQHLELALRYHLLALQGWEQTESRSVALTCILQTVRAFYSQLELPGQNQALSRLPSQLLAEILPQL